VKHVDRTVATVVSCFPLDMLMVGKYTVGQVAWVVFCSDGHTLSAELFGGRRVSVDKLEKDVYVCVL